MCETSGEFRGLLLLLCQLYIEQRERDCFSLLTNKKREKIHLHCSERSNCLYITGGNSCEMCVLCLALCLLNVVHFIFKNKSADASGTNCICSNGSLLLLLKYT